MDLVAELVDQLDWHWRNQLRPRLDGLTNAEYLWEPVLGCWSLRRRGEATTAMAAGGGDVVADFEFPEPEPTPITTIAWRLAHVSIGVFGMRAASHFGWQPWPVAVTYQNAPWSLQAAEGVALLDAAYEAWIGGVRGLSVDDLARPCGPAEGPFAEYSMMALILHIHREAIHHGAEVALLRDLYRHRAGLAPTS